jgi:hypothetical protein
METETFWTILAIIIGIFFIVSFVIGVINLFVFAINQGFIGLAVFLACWFFMWPVMLVVSLLFGFYFWALSANR